MSSRKKTKKSILFLSLLAIILLAALAFRFIKQHTNTTKGASNSPTKTSGSPLSKTPSGSSKITVNTQTRDTKSGQDPVSNPSIDSMRDADIGIVLTNASQDFQGGPVLINTRLSGVIGGTCSLTLTRDGVTVTKSAEIFMAGTYYSCDGFNVPYDELAPGTWNIKIMVTNTYGKVNDVGKTIEVK